jgi:predicted RNase H-like HicB family nuclease
MTIELEREEDGRWIAEVPELPGVLVYGQNRDEALANVKVLALRVLADRLEHGESVPALSPLFRQHEPVACCKSTACAESVAGNRMGG